ncbi:MAG: hypothetical protein APR62_10690 [Smithella sp. SDB]|nr:MAG: hypothetical protein APR62_10690 [Smithella sp. SDB]
MFCDLGVSFASEERHRAVTELRDCDHVDFLKKRISQREIWRRYAEYPFVLSTAGNGLDCHRTWELLYLGNIVITKTSSLDSLFEGLPVVVIDDWEEVKDKRKLKKWLQQYGNFTNRNVILKKLNPDSFIKSIREVLVRF